MFSQRDALFITGVQSLAMARENDRMILLDLVGISWWFDSPRGVHPLDNRYANICFGFEIDREGRNFSVKLTVSRLLIRDDRIQVSELALESVRTVRWMAEWAIRDAQKGEK